MSRASGKSYHDGVGGRQGDARIDAAYARLCRLIATQWTPCIMRTLKRSGGSAVAVLGVVAAVTVGRGKRSVRMSSRDLASWTGIARATVDDILGRLLRLGVVEMSEPIKGRTPTITLVTTWTPPEVPGRPGTSSDRDARAAGHLSGQDVGPAGHLSPEVSGRPDTPRVSSETRDLDESAIDELGDEDGTESFRRNPTTPVSGRRVSHETSLPDPAAEIRQLAGDDHGVVREGDHGETPNHHHDELGLGSETRARDGRAPDDDRGHRNPHQFRKNGKAEKRYGVRQSWTGLLAEIRPKVQEFGLRPSYETDEDARNWYARLDVAAAGYDHEEQAAAREVLAALAAHARRSGGGKRLAKMSTAVGRCAKIREAGSYTDFVALVRTYLKNALSEPLRFEDSVGARRRSSKEEALEYAERLNREIREEAVRRGMSEKEILAERYGIMWG